MLEGLGQEVRVKSCLGSGEATTTAAKKEEDKRGVGRCGQKGRGRSGSSCLWLAVIGG